MILRKVSLEYVLKKNRGDKEQVRDLKRKVMRQIWELGEEQGFRDDFGRIIRFKYLVLEVIMHKAERENEGKEDK